MSTQTTKYWWIPAIIGILFILFGAMVIKKPIDSFYAFSIFIGISLIVSGVAEIYFFSKVRKGLNDWSWYMSGGVVDVLLGVILITNPKIILIIFTLLISLLLFFRAIHIIRRAIELKNTKNKNWIWVLIVGVLLLGLTVLLVLKPEILGAALAFWIAIAFIAFGVYRLYLAFSLKQRNS